MYGMGAIIGPVLASATMTELGAGSLFLFAAVSHFSLAVFIASRRRLEDEVPDAEQSDFSESLTSALTASQVYAEEIEAEEVVPE